MARVFVYDGRELPDPDPKMAVEEVRQNMSSFFPELANAETAHSKRKSKADTAAEDDIYEFKRRVGTKGLSPYQVLSRTAIRERGKL